MEASGVRQCECVCVCVPPFDVLFVKGCVRCNLFDIYFKQTVCTAATATNSVKLFWATHKSAYRAYGRTRTERRELDAYTHSFTHSFSSHQTNRTVYTPRKSIHSSTQTHSDTDTDAHALAQYLGVVISAVRHAPSSYTS